jgi:hypothetical protein
LLDPCFDQREAIVDPFGVRQGFRDLAQAVHGFMLSEFVEAPAQKSQAGVEVAPLYEIRVMPTPKISDVHFSCLLIRRNYGSSSTWRLECEMA